LVYLLDANVLISANHLYYAIDTVPEYWAWLRHMAEGGDVKMPIEIFEELKDGPSDGDRDLLFAWVQDAAIKAALVLKEDVDPTLVQRVVSKGYAPDLTDDELVKVGRDPFLVAYALAAPTERIVVTAEASKPSKQRANRQVPDVCDSLGVTWRNPFEMNRALGFKTSWRAPRR
jgi:Domain of unknown function (DUF4411)